MILRSRSLRPRLIPAGAALTALTCALHLGCASQPAGPQIASCPTPTDPQLASAAEATLPARLPPGEALRGEPIYEAECSRCHASDTTQRSSRMFRAYPRLDCEPWLASVSDRYLHAAISVGGEAIGKKPVMAAFSESLDSQQIADVVAHLRAQAGR